MLPIRECALKLGKEARKRIAGKLTTPIFYDLHARYIDDRPRDLRGYTYEDFLIAHGLERPSELRSIMERFPKEQLVYYLRYVCVPDVMQVSTEFQRSRDLEDERLAVCSLLLDIDKENSNDYETEIREITRKQIIHGGVLQIEQSKISIDVEPIRRWAERNLKESFARYQVLVDAGMRAGAEGIAAAQAASAAKTKPDSLPEVPLDEASDLLLFIVRSLLNECFSNPYHGLDCYLSMRVRHGALSGQLRGPLEDEKIITQRQGGSGEYTHNDYWLQRIGQIDSRLAEKIDDLLRKFSRDYDSFITSFAKDRVQIQSSDHPEGLFQASFTTTRVVLLAHEIHSDTTFDGFVDLCLGIFWEIVDESLTDVRSYIDSSLKPRLNKL